MFLLGTHQQDLECPQPQQAITIWKVRGMPGILIYWFLYMDLVYRLSCVTKKVLPIYRF